MARTRHVEEKVDSVPVEGSSLRVRLVLVGLVLLAFGARMTTYQEILAADPPYLNGPDCYYHMRRIQATVRDFPSVPTFDAHQNMPDGSRIQWPPGFDGLLATAAWIGVNGRPWGLGFSAGAMFYLILVELMPESYRQRGHTGIAITASAAMSVVVLLHAILVG